MRISGSLYNGVLSFTEMEIKEQIDPLGEYFYLKKGILYCEGTSTQVLEGIWECYDSPNRPCGYCPQGNVYVARDVF